MTYICFKVSNDNLTVTSIPTNTKHLTRCLCSRKFCSKPSLTLAHTHISAHARPCPPSLNGTPLTFGLLGLRKRSFRCPGAVEKCQHRGGNGAAGLPGHRDRDHHGQEGPGVCVCFEITEAFVCAPCDETVIEGFPVKTKTPSVCVCSHMSGSRPDRRIVSGTSTHASSRERQAWCGALPS